MKFSFSTLGCPRWTLSEILSAAKDLGYAGVELRGLGDDIFLPDAQAFKAGGEGVKAEFESRGIAVSCISTECLLHKRDADL
ncbi:MAG: sugar phosphate isomerase/epimerase, partial [Clostridia bacterium]|nr:sugar phosphate isomerase/epimerase [Clostridia bacterium]